jgi:heme-degrading monooxygenase HmoA
MFARGTWVDVPPEKLDDLVASVRSALDTLGQQEGYRGAAMVANRETGAGLVVTYWETEQAMQASDAAAGESRAAVQRSVPDLRIKEVDRMEFALQERSAPPEANTFLRSNDIRCPPEKVAEAIGFLRDQVVPVIKNAPGFRAALVGVNRATGRILATSVWSTAAAREASLAAIEPLRNRMTQIVGIDRKVDLYEGLLVEIKLGTPA